eukprot:5320611-Pyramimonas_sp.AAC.1
MVSRLWNTFVVRRSNTSSAMSSSRCGVILDDERCREHIEYEETSKRYDEDVGEKECSTEKKNR